MQPTTRARTHRAISIVGALALIAGIAGFGTVASEAWFTAARSASASVTGALLTIGEIGRSADQKTIAVADVYPMTDAQAAAGAKSEWITVRNTGTIPLDWTMSIVNPQAKAPLTAAQLANFRFRLFDENGSPLTAPQVLGSMPATVQPGAFLTQGAALAAGGQKKVEIRVWLEQNSGNEFQGARASFDVIVNGIQNGAPSVMPVPTLTASPSGDPRGVSTALTWSDVAPQLASLGVRGELTYLVERSSSPDFADPVSVYSGGGLSATDTVGEPATASGETFNWGSVSLASRGGCGIRDSGASVYCWGDGFRGRLGAGNIRESSSPIKVTGGIAGLQLTSISAGAGSNCAISDSGRLYCWGAYPGDGSTGSLSAVAVDTSGPLKGKRVAMVAADNGNELGGACALTSDGIVACWGRATQGQYGNKDSLLTPVAVSSGALSGKRVSQVVSADSTTCALTTESKVACWGSNGYGSLGIGSSAAYSDPTPQQVNLSALGTSRISILSGGYGGRVCALTSAKEVFCWGDGVTAPAKVATPGLSAITAVEPVSEGLCVLNDGGLYCWGEEYGSAFGIGTPSVPGKMTEYATPVRVDGGTLAGQTVTRITAQGTNGVCAATAAGLTTCWGQNSVWLRLGLGGSANAVDIRPTSELGGNTLSCLGGSVRNDYRTCSLSPASTYYYRISYSASGISGSVGPAPIVHRS